MRERLGPTPKKRRQLGRHATDPSIPKREENHIEQADVMGQAKSCARKLKIHSSPWNLTWAAKYGRKVWGITLKRIEVQ
jgi:hypothetical protein